uniref:Uncharacterized protein n=1 Tax=Megaselia scalaris TaxID=36166 RepID=T1H2Z0_MEGSC
MMIDQLSKCSPKHRRDQEGRGRQRTRDYGGQDKLNATQTVFCREQQGLCCLVFTHCSKK